ncbi:hypothetical protein RFI_08211 [Reticulomyxa filosa]|uniref:Uncharacterized protein n=1 Tax=Reticulomyxa filosa TaxID=46433 RepID=X6NRL4_RETFI|nr:hypothetical protein RFI_08211 [Reticulomyxa filosa]|eukprot:ETO28915.1 hypothetical protein RFI_08211 [Reticulomyxa filosa]
MSYGNDPILDFEDFQPKGPSSSDEEETQKPSRKTAEEDTYDFPNFGQRPSEEDVAVKKSKEDDDELDKYQPKPPSGDEEEDEDGYNDMEQYQPKAPKDDDDDDTSYRKTKARPAKEEEDDMKKYQPKWAPSSDEEKEEPVVQKDNKRKSKEWHKSSDTEIEVTPVQRPQKTGFLDEIGGHSTERWNFSGDPQTPPSMSMTMRKEQTMDLASPHMWTEDQPIELSPLTMPQEPLIKEMTETNIAGKLGTPVETQSAKELTPPVEVESKKGRGSSKKRKNSKLLSAGDDKTQKKIAKEKSQRIKNNKKLKREASHKKRVSRTKSIIPIVERVPSNKTPTQIIRNVIQMDAATRRMLEEGKNAVMTKPKDKSAEEIMQYPFDQLLSIVKRKEGALQKLYENYSRRKPKMKLKDIRMQEILEVMECLVTCDDDKFNTINVSLADWISTVFSVFSCWMKTIFVKSALTVACTGTKLLML